MTGGLSLYVSLYRKYRPQTFAEVIGQDHITATLTGALTEGRLHHAYLFTGPRGTGKTSTARILAKAVNCVAGPTPTPDNTCDECRAITQGASIDVIEIDAASHGGVDDVRDLRDRVAFSPARARRRVYIIDECHMLSPAGWNAFLKTVEEPPGHVLFVFATTDPHKVPETILSRTQRFDFKRVPAAVLAVHVQTVAADESLTLEPGAVDLIANAGDGSVRDTLSVLEQVAAFTGSVVTVRGVAEILGAVPGDLLISATDAIATGDVAGLCIQVGQLAEAGLDPRQFARDLVEHLRGLFLLQVAPDSGLVAATPERLAGLVAQSGRLGRVELIRAMELLGEAQAQMRRGNTRLPLEIALAKAALPEASGDTAALSARLDRLERRAGVQADIAEPPAPAPAPAAPAEAMSDPPEAVEMLGRPVAEAPAIDFALVRSSWPALLEATKTRRRRPHALLAQGAPVELQGSAITVEFPAGYGYHAEQCELEQFQAIFSDAFTEVLGVPLRLRCRVAESSGEARAGGPSAQRPTPDDATDLHEAEAVAEAEAAEASGDLPDPARAHALAIEALRSGLGATILDDSSARP